MSQTLTHNPPIRITDLIELRKKGAAVTCSPHFEIVPVDFAHRTCRFHALVFICTFSGTVENRRYRFRKCYARGCPRDLCPQVWQAILIANRYLQRDYHRLEQSGIPIDRKLFTLEESAARLRGLNEDPKEAMIIDDYIQAAKKGASVSAVVALEFVPATEHFEYHRNSQTYLMADFTVTASTGNAVCQRCLGCYQSQREQEERPRQIEVANDRLWLLYREFDLASIQYEKAFFHL